MFRPRCGTLHISIPCPRPNNANARERAGEIRSQQPSRIRRRIGPLVPSDDGGVRSRRQACGIGRFRSANLLYLALRWARRHRNHRGFLWRRLFCCLGHMRAGRSFRLHRAKSPARRSNPRCTVSSPLSESDHQPAKRQTGIRRSKKTPFAWFRVNRTPAAVISPAARVRLRMRTRRGRTRRRCRAPLNCRRPAPPPPPNFRQGHRGLTRRHPARIAGRRRRCTARPAVFAPAPLPHHRVPSRRPSPDASDAGLPRSRAHRAFGAWGTPFFAPVTFGPHRAFVLRARRGRLREMGGRRAALWERPSIRPSLALLACAMFKAMRLRRDRGTAVLSTSGAAEAKRRLNSLETKTGTINCQ